MQPFALLSAISLPRLDYSNLAPNAHAEHKSLQPAYRPRAGHPFHPESTMSRSLFSTGKLRRLKHSARKAHGTFSVSLSGKGACQAQLQQRINGL